MSASPGEKELYEFGPFRIDPEKETVSRAGESVPLTPKTFQILLVLIRNSKQVVTKDDLMKTVWPDTFVEEANLSRNIFMLRKALGETAQDHRYIVTVPGRGYRLAESVQLVPQQEVSIIAASRSRVKVDVRETRPWLWITAAAVVVVAGAGISRAISHRRTLLTSKDTVVVADFANSTGDPVFDQTLRQGLSIQLEQSPFLSLISDQRIRRTVQLMGHTGDVRLTSEVARGVCERTGSAAVLEGSIAPLGSQYVVTLEAKSCRSGEVLDREQVQAAKKEDVLNALSQIASRFRERVGESLTMIQEHNVPLAEATTPSLEALEAFSAGWKAHTSSGAMAGLPLIKRAVEIDPNFALAYSTLGREYDDIDDTGRATEATTRAWQLRDHTSERERFVIAANYQALAMGNLEEVRQTDEAWALSYPREALPHVMLSGIPNKAAGRYELAMAEAQKAIELDPDFGIAYYNLAVNYVYLNRLDEAENILRRTAGRGIEIDEFIMLEYDIAFLQDDVPAMERAAVRARERSGGDTWITNKEAFAQAYSGHLERARILSQSAIVQAAHQGQPARAALWEAGESVREALVGDSHRARSDAIAALAISKDREAQYGSALALALIGDSSEAEQLADDLDRRFPEATIVRFSFLPVLRAQIALNRGDAGKAIESLDPAASHELGVTGDLIGALYPIYLRGSAYLALHRGAEAAAEFQKILDHRGIVGSDPIGALAHLQLARALALAGDRDRAKAAYQDFFTLWKDSDPEIPVLARARAEYAILQ